MDKHWLNLGEIVEVNAKKFRDNIALKDKDRTLTFRDLNMRTNCLANSLISMGIRKGDKVSCLLENSIEIIELYIAAAKTGIVINPINFRLAPCEVEYILNNADAKVVIAHEEFIASIDEIKKNTPNIKKFISVGVNPVREPSSLTKTDGGIKPPSIMKPLHPRQESGAFSNGVKDHPEYFNYESLIAQSTGEAPKLQLNPQDPWVMLYTSGTTGKPKGVVRSHESYIAFYLINAVDFGFSEQDICLNIMPLYHVNSTFFSFTFTYLGASVYIHPVRHFTPVEILEIIQREKISFISLTPTHYNLILAVPQEKRKEYDLSSIKKLLCSSAPARKEMKISVMEMFKGVKLYEAYGSTEAGMVTLLKPHEQMSKIGSIGRESCATSLVKILGEDGYPVPVGQIGELYSRSPMLFDEYYKLPEKTAHSFKDGWFTARDMAREDEDGYFYIVDRKDNMIITGGEHIYPSEIEEVIALHPAVFDVAVIGVPHKIWGEAVKAIVVLKEGRTANEQEIIDFCSRKMASFKKPKSVAFIKAEEMPRTGTGKILHRELRMKFSANHNIE